MKNTINLPELALVLLIGPSGSGKSTLAKRLFKSTEIVSSDFCRALISDDENSMEATSDAFDLAHDIIAKRLKRGLLTVLDATNLRPEDHKICVDIAKKYHVIPCAIVLNLPESVCQKQNKARTDRVLSSRVISNHIQQLRKSVFKLKYEGFRHIYEFKSTEEIAELQEVHREALWNNRKAEHGPFDIIGDIHGCYDELCELLIKLGYEVDKANFTVHATKPPRRLIFLGDLVDRGPDSPAVLKMVMNTVESGLALCVPGNHDIKLMRYLNGKNVQIKHGLELTVEQLANESDEFKQRAKTFIDKMVSHYVLDEGKLVVAHAGLKEEMQGRGSGAVREFCLYGETTGEIDEFGLPVRYNWASEYQGKAMVVYGHTPVPEAQWFNNTIDIDTGCVFGGKLTALRYPERELISVDAQEMYAQAARPFIISTEISLQSEYDDVLDVSDLIEKQLVETKLMGNITLREGNTITALEAMSRFAIHPKWLIYLPPTMSPSETSSVPELLEHPQEAFHYFRKNGIDKVVCQEKHMGSRAVVIVCKDEATVKNRFGLENEGIGVCYTRTGRRFFNDTTLEADFLSQIQNTLTERGFWQKFDTDWVCLDCELMPWSAKAQTLLQNQYAAVGASASAALKDVVGVLTQTTERQHEAVTLLEKYLGRQTMTEQYITAYRQYCWEVKSVFDYKLAPFHLLATEGKAYFDKDHVWHLEQLGAFCGGENNILMKTAYQIIDLDNEDSVKKGVEWWETLTSQGGEGMVVKPFQFINTSGKGLVQPAIKIRGREYLRIIYGLEYTAPENMVRLKNRGLSTKRSLALREFALGVEALERFVRQEPLRRVHQCVFGVLALESETVDPRL
jgi:protein phosphatase